jgi:nucleoporin NUP82
VIEYLSSSSTSDPVAAIAIPDDVYTTYCIFVITESLRFVSFSLSLRVESLDKPEAPEKPLVLTELSLPSSGPPHYTSLVSADPFTTPPVLTRPLGFPSIAKLTLPKSHNIKDEIQLTPETLRYLVSVSQRITGEIREAMVACHAVKNRTDICKQEFERQQKSAWDISERARQLIQTKRPELLDRMSKVQSEQERLIKGMKMLLDTLIKKASPDLNEHETKWFEELKRMKGQVMGVGRYDAESLKMRTRKVCGQSILVSLTFVDLNAYNKTTASNRI